MLHLHKVTSHQPLTEARIRQLNPAPPVSFPSGCHFDPGWGWGELALGCPRRQKGQISRGAAVYLCTLRFPNRTRTSRSTHRPAGGGGAGGVSNNGLSKLSGPTLTDTLSRAQIKPAATPANV